MVALLFKVGTGDASGIVRPPQVVHLPESITDNGHSLTLQTVNWQTEGDGHFTAVASYSGSATSSYVKGYTVTAEYAGTVSRINRRSGSWSSCHTPPPPRSPCPASGPAPRTNHPR